MSIMSFLYRSLDSLFIFIYFIIIFSKEHYYSLKHQQELVEIRKTTSVLAAMSSAPADTVVNGIVSWNQYFIKCHSTLDEMYDIFGAHKNSHPIMSPMHP